MCEKCNNVKSVSLNMVVEMESGQQEIPFRIVADPCPQGTQVQIIAEHSQIEYIGGFLAEVLPRAIKEIDAITKAPKPANRARSILN